LLVEGNYPIRQIILHPRIFVRWFSWELNPGVLWSFSLNVSATWGGGSIRLKATIIGRRAVPLFSLYLGIRLTTEGKDGNLSQGARGKNVQIKAGRPIKQSSAEPKGKDSEK
jgi:hypothetical protein